MVFIADSLLACIDYENGGLNNFPFDGGFADQPAIFWNLFKIAQGKFIELIQEKIKK